MANENDVESQQQTDINPEIPSAAEPVIESNESTAPQTNADPDIDPEMEPVVEEVVKMYDPDEKILSEWFESGKTTVTTNDLMSSGFDRDRVKPYSFNIGQFKLSRLLLISPYKLEKNS